MRRLGQSPSTAPPGNDQDVYLVLDDFGGWFGQALPETAVEDTNLDTVIEALLDGQ